MRYIARAGTRQFTIGVADDGHAPAVTFDGKALAVEWIAVGELPLGMLAGEGDVAAHFGLIAGTRSYDVFLRPLVGAAEDGDAQAVEVSVDGRTYTITLQDERTRALAGLAGEGHVTGDLVIRAPMPGLVSNILAEEGAKVERGQTVVVLEAMKMENDLTSPRTGVIKSLRVAKGQTVNQGDVLAIIGDVGAAPSSDEEE
jgi:biotin carboxyl carrier protein